MKFKFNEKKVEKEIQKTFPQGKIIEYEQFKKGLVHQTYKVRIKDPTRYLVVRLYKTKNTKKVNTNINALTFLHKKGFPTPKTYSNSLFANYGIIIMEYLKGEQAEKIFLNSSEKIKMKILRNAGALIRKLHKMHIPRFWIHYKHEIKNKKEWIQWINKRIEKYLAFAKGNLNSEYYQFLKKEFKELISILNQKMEFVPMHWDFHLGNILVNKNGDITGIIDFDNILKGDSLAELGQTHHSLRFSTKDYEYFQYFLLGYNKKLTKKEEKLILGYSLLHNVAVTRSIWKKKRRLSWIIKENLKIIKEIMILNKK